MTIKNLNFSVLEDKVVVGKEHETIPLISLCPCRDEDFCHRILIIYGGTTQKLFGREIVKNTLAMDLVNLGFMVHVFDFRSNLKEHDFYDFGLYDRVVDTRKIVASLTEHSFYSHLPLSVFGISMGGHIAVKIVSEMGEKMSNLILVAPAAYADDACRRGVKFGTKFSEILRRQGSWADAKIFKSATRVKSNVLMISYALDEVVPPGVNQSYRDAFEKSGVNFKDVELAGFKHAGLFTDIKKRRAVVREIKKFMQPKQQCVL